MKNFLSRTMCTRIIFPLPLKFSMFYSFWTSCEI